MSAVVAMSDEEPTDGELLLAAGLLCLWTARADQGRDDGGLPLSGMDKLRMIAVLGRLGTDDAHAIESLNMCPGAYAFGTRIILALAANGRLEEVVGPLPDDRLPEPDDEP